ncbi:hypothetical protein JCM6882_009655 [Rhodosporidiobolus microsporus]
MSLSFSGQVSLQGVYAYNGYSGQYHLYSAQIGVAGLSFPLSVYYETSRMRYSVEWQGVKDPVTLSEGDIMVKWGAAVLLAVRLGKGDFPSAESGSFTSRSQLPNHNSVQVEIRLSPAIASPSAAVQAIPNATRLAMSSAANVQSQVPADVCFFFPRTKHSLWGNEEFLKQASPYFKGVFSSGFKEGIPRPATTSASTSKLAAYSFDESDDETDKLEGKFGAEKRKGAKQLSSLPCKTITVTDTAYSTYLAVLVYLYSHHISFAPLLSTFRTSSKARAFASPSRASSVTKIIKAHPALPPPTSPKSVYRLAHLLDLADLASLALENLASQLTPQNAAYELYSDVATCYPAVRDVVLDYVVERWSEVKEAKATKEMEEKVDAGKLDGAAGTVMKLARKLGEKAAKA